MIHHPRPLPPLDSRPPPLDLAAIAIVYGVVALATLGLILVAALVPS